MLPILQLEVQCADGYDCQKIPRMHFYMPLRGLVDWEFSRHWIPEVRIRRMTNVLQQAKQNKDIFLMDLLHQNTTIVSEVR